MQVEDFADDAMSRLNAKPKSVADLTAAQRHWKVSTTLTRRTHGFFAVFKHVDDLIVLGSQEIGDQRVPFEAVLSAAYEKAALLRQMTGVTVDTTRYWVK